MVERDGALDVGRDARGGGEQGAGRGVVHADVAALGAGAVAAVGVRLGDRVQPLVAEGQRQDELAAVVQQPGEVRHVRVDTGALGAARREAGDLDRVRVHLPARGVAVAGGPLEEAVGDRVQGEVADAAAADHHHRLADGLDPHGPAGEAGVGEAQDAGGESGLGLHGGREVRRGRARVVGQGQDALERAVEHRQPGAAVDGLEHGRDDGVARPARGSVAGAGSHHECHRPDRPWLDPRDARRRARSTPSGACGQAAAPAAMRRRNGAGRPS